MNSHTIDRVRKSWTQVLPIAPQAADLFYGHLFALDPSLQPLFKGDMAAQGRKLMQMIGAAVGKLDEPATLLPILQGLGRRHGGYGVLPSHYSTVGTALLRTLSDGLGAAFTADTRLAWTEVYGALADTMMQAAAAQRTEPARA